MEEAVIDATFELDGLQGDQASEEYVRALMRAMFVPAVTVLHVRMEVGDGYGPRPVMGRASVSFSVNLGEDDLLKFLLEHVK